MISNQRRAAWLGAATVLGMAALNFSGQMARAQEAPAAPAAPAAQPPARQRGGGGNNRQGGQPSPVLPAFKATNPTADQQAKFDVLNTQMMADRRALRTVPAADRPAKQQALQTKFADDVKALLTDEQKKVFDAEMAKAQRGGGRGGMNLANALRPLNLTPDQQTKVDPIVKDTQDQLTKMMSDPNADRATMGPKMQTLITDMKAKIRPLLTPEQQTTLDGLQFRGGGRGGRGGAGGPGGQGGPGAPPPPPPAP